MKNTFNPYIWHENLRFRWIVLPVLAHLFSWMTGMGGIFLFPILLTIAQYLILKVHPAVKRPGAWFYTLPLTFFIWFKWGPLPFGHRSGDTVLQGITGYYAGQLLNTFFIRLVVGKGKPELLLSWLLSHAAAFAVWIVLYKLWAVNHPEYTDGVGFTPSLIWGIYPAIALIANALSSLVLTNNRVLIEYEVE